jgi:hypothetical protein
MICIDRSSASRTVTARLSVVACCAALLVLLVVAPRALAAGEPVITKEPVTQSVVEGGEATFEAAASGEPTPSVEWEQSTDGGSSWTVVSSAETLKITDVNVSETGDEYRAKFKNSAGEATTAAATLTVTVPPKLTTEPVSQAVVEGGEALFAAEASGTPTPTVQWYESVDGGSTWAVLALETSINLKVVAMTTLQSGDEYKAIFTNSAGKAESNAAVLTVEPKPAGPSGGSGGGSSGSGSGSNGSAGGSTGASPTAPPISPGPAGRIARYLPLTMATAPLLTRGAVAFQFKYAPGRFHAAHCVQKVSGRYRCTVSWRHGSYAFAGTVEVGNLNIYTGHYTYGLRVVDTNTRTHQHKTLRVAY